MNKKKLVAVFFLLIIVVVSFISLRVLNNMKRKIEVNETILKAVENTNWPVNDVPLISKGNLVVSNLGEYNCEAKITSGVSYDEVRKYLIKLYDIGFEPYEDLGSMNPNRLIPASSAESIKELSWIGQKDNYTINVLWAKEGATDDFGLEYTFNLEINLFINPGTTDFSNQEENELDNLDLENIEEIINSGELEISGEVIDVILEDEENVEEGIENSSSEGTPEDNDVKEEVENNGEEVANNEEQIIENEQVEGEINE